MLFAVTLAHALAPHGAVAPCATLAHRSGAIAEHAPRVAAAATGYDTEHFHIEGYDYDPTDEEYQLLGQIMEEVWEAEIGTLGYLEPARTDLFPVFLERMGEGLYGYTALGRDDLPYVSINSSMDWTGLGTEDAWKITSAHEFFHAIQYSYDYWEESWWMEASATWMEDEVYDEVNDYNYYLGEGQWPDYPEVSMVAANGWHEYGEVIWVRYLSTFWGGADTVKTLWEQCADGDILDVTVDLFGSREAFEAALLDFEVRNALGYAGYEEGGDWYPVYVWDLATDASDLPATGTPTEFFADYLGVNYWRIPLPESEAHDLAVDFTGNALEDGSTVRWQVAVVGTDGATWAVETGTTKDTLSLSLPGFGTTWHEGWVLVGILSERTGVDHDAYDSNPRYDKAPPAYTITARLEDPSPVDTGTVDTGAEDTGLSDTAELGDSVDSGEKDWGNGPRKDPGCGCASGGAGGLGAVVVGIAAALRRRSRAR